MSFAAPQSTLREAYKESIGRTLKRVDVDGVIREETALLMCGLLDGAVIAFHDVGDQMAALLCQSTSTALRSNWRTFLGCVTDLHAQL